MNFFQFFTSKIYLMQLMAASFFTQQPTQVSPYTQMADVAFKNLDTHNISSQILYDRVFPFSRLDAFTSLDTTGFQHFSQVYTELYSAHYSPQGKLISPDDFSDIVDWYRYKNELPIAAMDMQYQQLNTNAFNKKLLGEHGNILLNNSRQTKKIYLTKRIQIVSLCANFIRKGPVEITCRPELFLNNSDRKITSITLNLGKDLGEITLHPGERKTVDFENNGSLIIQASTQLSDGTSFLSKSQIEVGCLPYPEDFYPGPYKPTYPCKSETVIADIPFKGYDENDAIKGQCLVNYYFHQEENDVDKCTVRPLQNPIIVLDGFDPTDKRDAAYVYGYNFKYFGPDGKQKNLADDLRKKGHDIIIIDFPKFQVGSRKIELPNHGGCVMIGKLVMAGGDYIERLGYTLVKVIQQVNEQLAAQKSTDKLVIVGPSQGGLISRFALDYMEQHSLNHNCKLWFSWDATHQGSVFPIGEQYFVKAMADLGLKGAKDGIKYQVDVPGARQQLLHHHLSNSVQVMPAPGFKKRFYATLDSMGWPQIPRKVCMISGAVDGTPQPAGTAGKTGFDFNLKMKSIPNLLLFGLLTSLTNHDVISANIKFSPSSQSGVQQAEVFNMKVLGITVKKGYSGAFPLSKNSLELIQGGCYPGFKEIRDSTRTKMKGFFNAMVDPLFLNVIDNHAHQPSGNTLALGKGPHPHLGRMWDDDLTKENINCGLEKEIPFDAWYAPPTNLRHDSLTWDYAWRMMDEIEGRPIDQPKPTKNTQIIGSALNMVVGEEREFSVADPQDETGYNWTTNSNNLQIISGQGSANVLVKYLGGVNDLKVACATTAGCYNYGIKPLSINGFSKGIEGTFSTKKNGAPYKINFLDTSKNAENIVFGNETQLEFFNKNCDTCTVEFSCLQGEMQGLNWSQKNGKLWIELDSNFTSNLPINLMFRCLIKTGGITESRTFKINMFHEKEEQKKMASQEIYLQYFKNKFPQILLHTDLYGNTSIGIGNEKFVTVKY